MDPVHPPFHFVLTKCRCSRCGKRRLRAARKEPKSSRATLKREHLQNHAKAKHGGRCLKSEHLGGRDRRNGSLGAACATYLSNLRQRGPPEIMSHKNKSKSSLPKQRCTSVYSAIDTTRSVLVHSMVSWGLSLTWSKLPPLTSSHLLSTSRDLPVAHLTPTFLH